MTDRERGDYNTGRNEGARDKAAGRSAKFHELHKGWSFHRRAGWIDGYHGTEAPFVNRSTRYTHD